MADKDLKVSEGELIAAQDGRSLRERQETDQAIASRASRTRWRNELDRRRIESATKVVQAQGQFLDAYSWLEKAKDRLRNIGIDLEADQVERIRRLRETQLAGEIAQEEQTIRLMQLRKMKAQLQGDGDEDMDKYERQLREAERKMEFEAKKRVLEARKALYIQEQLRKERDEMKAEILRAVKGEPTDEQRLQLENLDDLFQKLIDEVR